MATEWTEFRPTETVLRWLVTWRTPKGVQQRAMLHDLETALEQYDLVRSHTGTTEITFEEIRKVTTTTARSVDPYEPAK